MTLLLTLAEVLITCASSPPQAVHHETEEQAFQGHHVISGQVAVKPYAWIGWGRVDGWIGASCSHTLDFLCTLSMFDLQLYMYGLFCCHSKFNYFILAYQWYYNFFSGIQAVTDYKDNPAKVCNLTLMNGVWVKAIKSNFFFLSFSFCHSNDQLLLSSLLHHLSFQEQNTTVTANKNQRATVQSWTVMTHRRAIDTDLPENICDDIRQLPWSWAKARLLVDFEVVTPVSWPLSQRDETYGHHSVRTEKVYHTNSSVWLTFQYVLIFSVVLKLYWFI